MAARLQESRAEAGVVAAPRTEAQRMAVQDDCAERPRGWLCGTTVQTEEPRVQPVVFIPVLFGGLLDSNSEQQKKG
ncbi:hypothetical protein MC885_011616, partial [Smutsia gigantea]